jgi:hypothetical protein
VAVMKTIGFGMLIIAFSTLHAAVVQKPVNSVPRGTAKGKKMILLGMGLENMVADAACRLGDPDLWRAAVASLP